MYHVESCGANVETCKSAEVIGLKHSAEYHKIDNMQQLRHQLGGQNIFSLCIIHHPKEVSGSCIISKSIKREKFNGCISDSMVYTMGDIDYMVALWQILSFFFPISNFFKMRMLIFT